MIVKTKTFEAYCVYLLMLLYTYQSDGYHKSVDSTLMIKTKGRRILALGIIDSKKEK